MYKVFIDGKEGTTGLRIYDRLAARPEIELLTLPEELRKDPAARATRLNEADLVFLCLPDAAAKEAVEMIENPHTRVLDTSTAHRTDPGWLYGFPELLPDAGVFREAKRVAVPGCHASGFIALVRPLVQAGLLPADAALTCHSVTGYSGGGRKMIAAYEAPEASPLLGAPRQYGLTQQHKHLREMQALTGLEIAPLFSPIVAPFYSGMVMTVPLFRHQLCGSADDVREVYRGLYNGPVVRYLDAADEEGFFSAGALSGSDAMQITVAGNEERILLLARYDNLGKGASGAAIQCMNLMIECEQTTGLQL